MRDITKFTELTDKEIEDLLAKYTMRIVNMISLTEEESNDLRDLTLEAHQRGILE